MAENAALAVSKDPDDAELVWLARAGDARAMERLIRRHNRTLYRTARAILNDDAEAEDAVQETWLQAFRGIDAFRAEAALSTWLVRIAANEALMRRRRRVRRAEVVPLDAESADSLMESIADEPSAGPERQAMNAEVRRVLEARIGALPDAFRAVFVMRAVEEMSVEETAAALDLPEATVRTRLFRARALLRGALEQQIEDALEDVFAFDGERCDRIVATVLARLAR